MTDINYKEEMKLTPEEIEDPFAHWESINTGDTDFIQAGAEEQLKKCLRVLSSMELPELPRFNAIDLPCKGNGDNCAKEIDTCGECYLIAQRNADLANIQPIIAAQIGYREILRDDVVQLQNELDKQIVENEGLKAQLSTARAETAKEIKGKVITSLCPNSISAGQVDVIFSAYLAPDKEGGK